MGAESILSALLPVILDMLISPAIEQLGVVFGTKEKLQKLKRIFERIQSVIVDAEERQTIETPIKNWLSDLKDLAYRAEDLLEDFQFEAQRKKSLNQVLSYCSFYKPFMTRFRLCRRLNDIVEKIEAIADEINKFNFQLNRVPQIFNYSRPQTHSYVDKETVIGREKDKEDIVSFLIKHDVSNKKEIMVLPIVAMGGMGKTTLSQLVYRDHRVESHFQLLIWVCVSDADFDLARLVRLIIEAATDGKCKLDNMELLQKRLREIISGKRYLIVLDDVWNENPNQWNRLKILLDCGGEGSTVLVSTRSTIVAKMTATHTDTIHYLEQLSEEDSWELFRRRAFGEGAEQTKIQLVQIGKDIVKRCGGLPLAIDTLGSMMRFKNDEEEWKAVLGNHIWKIQAAKDNILPALRLSYNYLPSHLKQCFAFCAIYPKDYQMDKDGLIELWMANGYIPSDGARDLDAMGRDIFDELVWRSFFQNVVEHGFYDNRYEKFGYHDHVTCKMHDLMHDLAQSIRGKECLNFEDTPKLKDIPSIARNLLMPRHQESSIPRNHPILPNICTVAAGTSYVAFDDKLLLIKYLSMLKSLRVLTLSCLRFNKDVNISHLRHLRWLDLSDSHMVELPESICSLYNLQTLKLIGCGKLKKLPENFTNLVNLRHLYTNWCFSLVRMPRAMGRLKQLHTLTMYIVSAEAENGIEQLRDLNLGGKLDLYGIENVSNAIDAEEASLSSKQNLRSITLSWGGAGSLEVFEALKPHDGLRVLAIRGYGGQHFPRWMNDPQQLQNLISIKLEDCGKCKDLPSLGQLPLLEVLILISMLQVKHIIKTTWCDIELNTKLFPSLKTFKMFDMENLEDWWEVEGSNAQVLSDRLQFLPCLTTLSITNCKNLTTIPAIPSLQDLTLNSCNPNLTTNIFSITTDKGLVISQLQTLEVSNCEGLVHLPACLPSTHRLVIAGCNRLESLPGPGSLTKLQKLELSGCGGLESLPRGMEALTHLHIENCNRLTSLPEDLTKLDSLFLNGCNGLASLPQGISSRHHQI